MRCIPSKILGRVAARLLSLVALFMKAQGRKSIQILIISRGIIERQLIAQIRHPHMVVAVHGRGRMMCFRRYSKNKANRISRRRNECCI